jgi:hypothetical protein
VVGVVTRRTKSVVGDVLEKMKMRSVVDVGVTVTEKKNIIIVLVTGKLDGLRTTKRRLVMRKGVVLVRRRDPVLRVTRRSWILAKALRLR